VKQGPAAKPRLQAQLQATADLAAERLDGDIRALVGSAPGARVFSWLIYGVCGLEDASWDGHGGVMNLKEGRRSVGRDVVNRLRDLGVFREVYEARFEAITAEDADRKAFMAQGENEDV